jgi:hypothetical protein
MDESSPSTMDDTLSGRFPVTVDGWATLVGLADVDVDGVANSAFWKAETRARRSPWLCYRLPQ